MVEKIKSFKFKKPNDKQTYAATIFAVTGGTIMYTVWQFIVPTEITMPPINPLGLTVLALLSLGFVSLGYNIYSEERR